MPPLAISFSAFVVAPVAFPVQGFPVRPLFSIPSESTLPETCLFRECLPTHVAFSLRPSILSLFRSMPSDRSAAPTPRPKGKRVVELPVLREAEICEGTGNRNGQPTRPERNA